MCTLVTLLSYLTRILLFSLFDQFTLSREESYQLCFTPKLPMGTYPHTGEDWPNIKGIVSQKSGLQFLLCPWILISLITWVWVNTFLPLKQGKERRSKSCQLLIHTDRLNCYRHTANLVCNQSYFSHRHLGPDPILCTSAMVDTMSLWSHLSHSATECIIIAFTITTQFFWGK